MNLIQEFFGRETAFTNVVFWIHTKCTHWCEVPLSPLKKHTRSYEVEHCVRIHIYKCQTHNQILHTNICTSYFINDFALFSYSSLLFATKNPLNYHNLFNSIFLMRSTFPTFNFDSCFSTLSIHKYFEIAYYI